MLQCLSVSHAYSSGMTAGSAFCSLPCASHDSKVTRHAHADTIFLNSQASLTLMLLQSYPPEAHES